MIKQTKTICIIGGGFSGIAVAINLINLNATPLRIVLIEGGPNIPNGIAFASHDPLHPLNVRTIHMGLLPTEPEDFFHWLKDHPHRWKAIDPSSQKLEIAPHSYVPRMIYNAYLEERLEEAKAHAKAKEISFDIIQSYAIEVNPLESGQLEIALSTGSTLLVDYLVLATGVAPYKKLPFESPQLTTDPRYTSNVWNPHPESILKTIDITEGDVLIIGTGLTMADIVLSLVGRGFNGKIHAISKSGQLPAQHLKNMQVKLPQVDLDDNSTSLLDIMKDIRNVMRIAKQEGFDWRSVIDTIRPALPMLWQRLTVVEKKQFLRHVLSFWNKHRHRLPPETASLLNLLQSKNTLNLLAGRIEQIENTLPDRLRVCIRHKDESVSQWLEVKHIINCTGPEYTLTKQPNELLQNLLKQKLIQPDALDMGIALSPEGWALGTAPGKIYTLGALLFGERFETTAVPEIREQAAKIAQTLSMAFFRAEE